MAHATSWLTGSLNSITYAYMQPAIYALILLGPAALCLSFWLDCLELGDDAAAGLDVRVDLVKVLVIIVGVTLAALAVASTGPSPL